MTVREFDGVDDRLFMDVGSLPDGSSTAFTILAVWKPLATEAGCLLRVACSGGSATPYAINPFSDGQLYFSNGSFNSVAYDPADGWLLTAFRKDASGSNSGSAHTYEFDTDTWSHTALGTFTDSVATPDTVQLGWFTGTEYGAMRLAAVAVFNRTLTDGQMEQLTTSVANWEALDPVTLWVFNQNSTSDPVTDLTGNGADQNSIDGTTVVTGDDPPGFDMNLGYSMATTQTPGTTDAYDGNNIVTGTIFRFAVAGRVVGIRWYAPTTTPGFSPVGGLYEVLFSSTGTLLDSSTFGTVSLGKWNVAAFDPPVEVDAAVEYLAAVFTDHYVASNHFFQTAPVINGPVEGIENADPYQNGRFEFPAGSLTFPTSTFQESFYFADVVFVTGAAAATGTAVTGTLALGLPASTAAATGAISVTGALALDLPALALETSGPPAVTGTLALDPPAASVALISAPPVTGALGLVLPAVTTDLNSTGTALTGVLMVADQLTACILDGLAAAGAEAPQRVITFGPGEVTDDQCDCGLLAISASRVYYSNNGPTESLNPPPDRGGRCGVAYRVYDLTVRIMRCAPVAGDGRGAPPTPAAILEAAAIWQTDLDTVRESLGCCLNNLQGANMIAGFALGAQEAVGPAGGCQGSITRVLYWVNNCLCATG